MSGRREPERSGRREKDQSGQRRRDVVYGRNPVTGGAPGSAGVRRVWTADDTDAAELTRDPPAHPITRASSRRSIPTRTRIPRRALRSPRALRRRARPGPGSAQPRRDLPQRRGGRTAGDRDPGAPRGGGHGGGRQGIGEDGGTAAGDLILALGGQLHGARAGRVDLRGRRDGRGLLRKPRLQRDVLVLGGEEPGIRPRVASACDGLVRIPTVGKVGSLNVSWHASVLLFAASRVAS